MRINKLFVNENSIIRQAIKTMDMAGLGIVFVVDDSDKLLGVITDGDFRRAILKGVRLDDNVKLIFNDKYVYVVENEDDSVVEDLFLRNKVDRIPVLRNGRVVDLLLREDYKLKDKVVLPESEIDIPVVIMAGGEGKRLLPFTNVLPKPLIPIGGRAMIEIILDEYKKFGFRNFYISVNYKANLIKAYFSDNQQNYNISYLEEKSFLGTAGSLKMLKLKKKAVVFVSNCDILIKDNYLRILDFHKKKKYDFTLVAAIVHHKVPYGVCTLKQNGELDKLLEKPEYDYLVNTGMYVLNSSVLDLIPENSVFHITDLMEKIRDVGGKIGVYPVSQKAWADVGQWNEYRRIVDLLS